MSALSIQPTYPIFTDIDGQPLEDGYVWIGTANLDPQTNPINVYWDAALTLPAAQPIRTLAGYPVNSGTPARLYVNSDYSIRVMNKNGSIVYSAPQATERYGNVVSLASLNFLQLGANAVTRTALSKMQDTISIKDFGAVGDGVTDDTNAIQDAIDAVASGAAKAGVILFPKATYKIAGKVLFGANISFDFDGSTLIGTGTGGNTMFESAYWDGSQMLSNIATGPENNRVVHSIIDGKGATIQNCGKAFNLKNFNEDCEIANIYFGSCTQNIYSARPFYSRYVNLTSRGSANNTALPAFYFSEAAGACVWESIYVIDRVLAFEIDGPSSNSAINQCSFESCTDGIRFSGYTSGPATVTNNYFEFIAGKAIEFSGDDYVENIWVLNNFFNDVDTMIRGRQVRNGCFGNYTIAAGVANYTIDIGDPFSPCKVDLNARTISTPALPAYFLQPNRSVTPWQEERIFEPIASGNVAYKNINQGLATPFHYSGDCGPSFNDLIPFCVATKVNLGAGNFRWDIDTQIVWRADMIHAAYYFRATDNSGTHKVGGTIMGDQVGAIITAAGRTVTVTDNGGFLRVTISGFNHPTLAGFIYGYVKLI